MRHECSARQPDIVSLLGSCKVSLPHPSNSPLQQERGEPCRLPPFPLAILERGRGEVNCTTLTLQQPCPTTDRFFSGVGHDRPPVNSRLTHTTPSATIPHTYRARGTAVQNLQSDRR